jgi:DNA-binding transcriptional MerR regulator
MLTIGDFAQIAGVTAKTLRAYDAAGLFGPAWTDPSTRYRYYSPAQLPELRRILGLRGLGLGLDDIGRLVSGGADLRAALARRREELERERRELDRRLASIEIQVSLAEDGSPAPDVVVRSIATEPVATLDVEASADGDVGAAFYRLEAFVRDAGIRAQRPPGAFVDADTGHQLVFVPVRRPFAPADQVGFRRLSGGRAITLLHRGGYATLPASRLALEAWAAASGHVPAGPLRTLYLQFGAEPELQVPPGWVVRRGADFVTELQLPVDSGA